MYVILYAHALNISVPSLQDLPEGVHTPHQIRNPCFYDPLPTFITKIHCSLIPLMAAADRLPVLGCALTLSLEGLKSYKKKINASVGGGKAPLNLKRL